MQASEFLNHLKNLKQTDLLEIKGLGPVLVENILEFVGSDRFEKLHREFQSLEAKNRGLEIILPETKTGPLSGQRICITGSFDIPRGQIQHQLEQLGAICTNIVSSNTTILLAGEKAGSKLAKAQELGIKILTDYQELLEL